VRSPPAFQAHKLYKEAEQLFAQDKLAKKISKCASLHAQQSADRAAFFEPLAGVAGGFAKNQKNGQKIFEFFLETL
jgi:hypothetical protein